MTTVQPNPTFPLPVYAEADLGPWDEWEALPDAEAADLAAIVLVQVMGLIIIQADRNGVVVDVDSAPGWDVVKAEREGRTIALLQVTGRCRPKMGYHLN